jgi:hypothetical protein
MSIGGCWHDDHRGRRDGDHSREGGNASAHLLLLLFLA